MPFSVDAFNARLSIGARMRILSALMIVPVAIIGYLLFGARQEVIDFANKERAGAETNQVLWSLAVAGARDTGVDAALSSSLKGALPLAELTSLSQASGEALMVQALKSLDGVTDRSGLILDPDLDSFYMMDLVSVQLPKAMHTGRLLYDVRTREDTDLEHNIKEINFQDQIAQTAASLNKAREFSKTKTFSPEMEAAAKTYDAAGTAFIATHDEANYRAFVDQADAFHKFAAPELERLLQQRADKARGRLIAELGGVALVLALAVGMSLLIGASLTRRLRDLTDVMQRLIKGKAVANIPYQDDQNETGVIVAVLKAFRETLAETEQMRKDQQETELANAQSRQKAMLDLAARFETDFVSIVDAVNASADTLGDTAQALTDDAARTTQRSSMVSNSMDVASANVQSVAGATEEMAASSHSIADQAERAAAAAEGAANKAHETTRVVSDMNAAAQKIGSAIDMISQITSQTNLLALNATIEAARAGEAGRGFSVVAAEVKALAQQTARATEEISAQVRGVQDATTHAGAAMTSIAQVVMELRDISAAISDSVGQQTQAVAEISRSTAEVAGTTSEISESVADVNETAHNTGERAKAALQEAQRLSVQADALRSAADGFLKGIRAA